MKQSSLSQVLHDGPIKSTRGREGRLTWRRIGEMDVPSGRLIAADLFMPTEEPPFARQVKPGAYGLHIGVAELTNKDQYIALAMLRLTDRPLSEVARWELAACEPRSDGLDDEDGPQAAFGVDMGAACLCDAETAEQMRPVPEEEWDAWCDETVTAALDQAASAADAWVILPAPGGGPRGYAAFASGFGDGVYCSYWGLDEAGEPMALVIDFKVAFLSCA